MDMVIGCVLVVDDPLEPFEFTGLVGLDVIEHDHRADVELVGDREHSPHLSLSPRVAERQGGRKSDSGWCGYDGERA